MSSYDQDVEMKDVEDEEDDEEDAVEGELEAGENLHFKVVRIRLTQPKVPPAKMPNQQRKKRKRKRRRLNSLRAIRILN